MAVTASDIIKSKCYCFLINISDAVTIVLNNMMRAFNDAPEIDANAVSDKNIL